MRKILLFMFVLAMTNCSKSSDDGSDVQIPAKESKYKLDGIDITGVWKENGKQGFFLSFSDDKLFSGYLDNYTIDDGDYSVKGDTILVKNTYLGHDIRFVITQASDEMIGGELTYFGYNTDYELNETKKSMYLKKTTDTPCRKSNQIIGKTFTSFVAGGMKYHYTVIKHNFMTYTLNTYDSNIVKESGTLHYLYLPPKIYYTMYYDYGIWQHYGLDQLNICYLDIDSDGLISLRNLY